MNKNELDMRMTIKNNKRTYRQHDENSMQEEDQSEEEKSNENRKTTTLKRGTTTKTKCAKQKRGQTRTKNTPPPKKKKKGSLKHLDSKRHQRRPGASYCRGQVKKLPGYKVVWASEWKPMSSAKAMTIYWTFACVPCCFVTSFWGNVVLTVVQLGLRCLKRPRVTLSRKDQRTQWWWKTIPSFDFQYREQGFNPGLGCGRPSHNPKTAYVFELAADVSLWICTQMDKQNFWLELIWKATWAKCVEQAREQIFVCVRSSNKMLMRDTRIWFGLDALSAAWVKVTGWIPTNAAIHGDFSLWTIRFAVLGVEILVWFELELRWKPFKRVWAEMAI